MKLIIDKYYRVYENEKNSFVGQFLGMDGSNNIFVTLVEEHYALNDGEIFRCKEVNIAEVKALNELCEAWSKLKQDLTG